MDPKQFSVLIDVLKGIKDIDNHYTLTGADDWNLFITMCGVVAAMLALLIGVVRYMHADLKAAIKDGRTEWKNDLDEEKSERGKQIDYLWSAMRECQADCCPRRKPQP